jgi:cell division protein ZapA
MTDNKNTARVSVRILEKEYVVACPVEERSALLDSAELLNARLRDIRESGKVVGLDRMAVIAALNLAHDLIKLQQQERDLEQVTGQRVKAMRERIDTELGKHKQLEL